MTIEDRISALEAIIQPDAPVLEGETLARIEARVAILEQRAGVVQYDPVAGKQVRRFIPRPDDPPVAVNLATGEPERGWAHGTGGADNAWFLRFPAGRQIVGIVIHELHPDGEFRGVALSDDGAIHCGRWSVQAAARQEVERVLHESGALGQ